MKHYANDLAHICFIMLVLWIASLGLIWCVLSGFLIGWLIEIKEENSNVLVWESWGHIGVRDLIGYTIGGLIIGVILFGMTGCRWYFLY